MATTGRIAGFIAIAVLILVVVVVVVLARSGPTPVSRATPAPWATAIYTPGWAIPTLMPLPGTPRPMLDFELAFELRGSDFTRTVDASLTNTGTIDAHNVKATSQVWSGNTRIRVNGQDMLVEELGNLTAGAIVTRSITVSVSFFDGLKLQTNGGVVIVDITSDEGSKQFRFII